MYWHQLIDVSQLKRDNLNAVFCTFKSGFNSLINCDFISVFHHMYMQLQGVAMGSPLGPLLANIFMCELENTIIPTLANDVDMWTRYVDDTFAFMKANQPTEILRKLNSFHPSIQFTYEKEKYKSISFLDVLVKRDNENKLNTSVYRKSTSNDIYINWYAHVPNTWKIATLRILIKRAFSISSNGCLIEVKYVKNAFCTYILSKWLITLLNVNENGNKIL